MRARDTEATRYERTEAIGRALTATFHKHPHRFFTEHDIHSELHRIATARVNASLRDGTTCDGYVVNRIHHEYPTPFRCLMKNSGFRVITEQEFTLAAERTPGFRARRGFLDFVMLHPDYVSSNTLTVVSGKRLADLRAQRASVRFPALDVALEVVYYPVFDPQRHEGIMKRRIASTIQDYKKLLAVRAFTDRHGNAFCREAAMLLFSNTTHIRGWNAMTQGIPVDDTVLFFNIMKE